MYEIWYVNTDTKDAWSYTSTPQYIFVWHGGLLIKKKGSITFFLVDLVEVYGTEHNFH
jgi:hypothetical protein